MSRDDEAESRDSSVGPVDAVGEALVRAAAEGARVVGAVADRMGVAATDLQCLLTLHAEGPATAGRLAERARLTSGAITGVVDRLVRAGWVERVADPADRRRVVVAAVAGRRKDLEAAWAPLREAAGPGGAALGLPAGSAAAVVAALGTTFATAVEGLRHPATSSGGPATLRLTGWLGPLRLLPADVGPALARAAVGSLHVRAAAGVVTVSSVRAIRRGEGPPVLEVERSARWAVELRGGAHRALLDLAAVDLESLLVDGGANRLEVLLPAPGGPVPVRIRGGANRVEISRPAGVPVQVTVHGGAQEVRVDGARVPSGTGVEWRSHGGCSDEGRRSGGGAGRYEVEITGGANRVTFT